MTLLRTLQRIYSLDTLDTRLTTSSSTPLKAVSSDSRHSPAREIHASKDGRAQEIAANAPPSKWNTPEFYFYYLVFLTMVPLMFKTVMDVSKESFPTYPNYSRLLSPGWVPGRKVDNSDAQYASFRGNIPSLLILLVVQPLLRRVYNFFHSIPEQKSPDGSRVSAANADARLKQRTAFDLGFALLFLVGLHGVSVLKIFVILYVNYRIAKGFPRSYVPAATWVFNLVVLFANELCDGYPLSVIVGSFVSAETDKLGLIAWAQYLDGLGGLIPRWHVLFKFTILRLISFNMDYYWSLSNFPGSALEKKQLDPASLSERDRVSVPADPASYNALYYAAYVLYSPLYLSGPIITFNDYISQQRFPSPALTSKRILMYGIRFFLTLLCMELVLHYIYAVAISKATSDWSAYTPGQLSMLGYFNLHIIWLKLLIPWRFFRLWALLDGIDPPENMVRCMSNNYSTLAFWRAWHRSYNRWVVRYLYIPIGGGRSNNNKQKSSLSPQQQPPQQPSSFTAAFLSRARGVCNQLIVFTFVAVWHDINLRLLTWGWLVTLFVLPEVIATLLFPAHKWRTRPTAYRILCGIGAVGNVLLMISANLVGFALGLDGFKGLVAGIFDSWMGVVFTLAACSILFVGVQVMFETRESEKRKGIKLNY